MAYTSEARQQLLDTLRTQPTRSGGSPPASPRAALPATSTRRSRRVSEANRALAELQDSILPVEAGDPELRSGATIARAKAPCVIVSAASPNEWLKP